MTILGRYLAATVIGGALVALLIVVLLIDVFEFIDETGDVGQGRYTLGHALLVVLLATPQVAYEAFPMATLIGALVGLGNLAVRHELVVMRAAGVSVMGVARAVVGAGVVLALLAGLLGEWVAPHGSRLAQDVRTQAMSERLSGTGNAFWVRDGDRYIRIERAPQPNLIEDVSIYRREGGELASVTHALRGSYRSDGDWLLAGVEITTLNDGTITVEHRPSLDLASELTPEMLEVVVVEPGTLAIPELLAYIDYQRRNGLDSERYRLAFWVKIATPLATVTMLVLTVPLVLSSARRAGAGQQIFFGVLIGIAFFLLNRLLNNAGLIYGLPPVVSAFAPTAIFLVVGLIGLARVR